MLNALALAFGSSVLTHEPATVRLPAIELVWFDSDGDGHLDVYVLDPEQQDRLLEGRGEGRFEDVTETRGLASASRTLDLRTADFDHDGRVDLARIVEGHSVRLLRNTGTGYVDLSVELGLAGPHAELSVRWLDFDGDSWLDLEVQGARGPRLMRNMEGKRFERVQLGLQRPVRTATGSGPANTPPANATAGNATAATSSTSNAMPLQPLPRCVDGIVDQSQQVPCLLASSTPALGQLMPLSNDFFVDPAGRVGIGTTAPTTKLDVAGALRAQSLAGDGSALTALDAGRITAGTLGDVRLSTNVLLGTGAQSIAGAKTFTTAPSFDAPGAPFHVASTSRVANMNADLLDGLDSSAFMRSMPVPLVVSGTSALLSAHANASTAPGAIALLGETSATSATRSYGVVGRTWTRDGIGVYGEALGTGAGSSFGGFFESDGANGFGAFARCSNSSGGYGGWFEVASSTGTALGASAESTSNASSNASNGLYVRNRSSGPNAHAAVFDGKVHVNGTLSKAAGSFKIDHPLDPANKTLSHSFVESPDMLNVYSGNVTTDSDGAATIELPEWFEALNRDFRYQLTVIDAHDFALARVERGVESNRFTLRTDRPRVLVSWQVSGVRKDAWAEHHRIPVEEEKTGPMRGRYLNPEVHGQPPELGIGALVAPRAPELVPR